MSLVLQATVVDARREDPLALESDLARYAYLARYSGRTHTAYAIELDMYFAWCRNRGVEPLAMTRPQIELWLRDLETTGYTRHAVHKTPTVRHYKASSLDRKLSVIAGFYKFAHIDGRISKDPAAHVARPRVFEEPRRDVDSHDMRRLLSFAERVGGTRYVLCLLMAHNGLRVSEACGLNVEDLGEEQGHRVARFVGKGNKPARVPLAPPVARAIDRHVGERRTGPILLREDIRKRRKNEPSMTTTRLDRRTAYEYLRQLSRWAGLDYNVHPHMLRAAFVSEGLAAGIPVADMQHDARHSDPRTTMRYDRRKQNLDTHATYIISSRLSGG